MTPCKPWIGPRTASGVGYLRVDGVRRLAHELAWETRHGLSIPAGETVIHQCGTALCINPDHLVLASVTASESARNGAKLSPEDVITVRHLGAMPDITRVAIAEAFGVSRDSVSRTCRGLQNAGIEQPTINEVIPVARRVMRARSVTLDGLRRRSRETRPNQGPSPFISPEHRQRFMDDVYGRRREMA